MKVLVIGDSYGLPRYAKTALMQNSITQEHILKQLRRMLSANFTEDVCLVKSLPPC